MTFEAYTLQHYIPLAVSLVIGVLSVRRGKSWSADKQRSLGVILAIIVVMSMLIGDIILMINGEYDLKEDLPLYLCRTTALLFPFAIALNWRKALGVFYFWTLAGTLQALLTPDLAEGFPNYFYFRYWALHAGLVICALYSVIVFKLRIGWPDFWRAVIWTQVYIFGVHLLNWIIGSNYSYTMRKPPGTILDYMGPWPWYILVGEGVMLFLFLAILLPFLIKSRKAS